MIYVCNYCKAIHLRHSKSKYFFSLKSWMLRLQPAITCWGFVQTGSQHDFFDSQIQNDTVFFGYITVCFHWQHKKHQAFVDMLQNTRTK